MSEFEQMYREALADFASKLEGEVGGYVPEAARFVHEAESLLENKGA